MRVISEQIEVVANGHENENGEDSGAHSSPIVGSLPLLQSTMILLREHQASASFHAGHKKTRGLRDPPNALWRGVERVVRYRLEEIGRNQLPTRRYFVGRGASNIAK